MTDTYELVGIGIGPFNLALAALAEPTESLTCLFLDENAGFGWHPGMMVDGARLQVPFLADLVSLVDPTNRNSYLAWLRDQGRLFGFYFSEAWHVPRAEYESYCRAVAERLESCRFGCRVTAVRHAALADGRDGFVVCYDSPEGPRTVLAANVALGIGTEPVVPGALRALCEDGAALVSHSAHYLNRADWIRAADDVTVLGSGQSGAEIVLDLLRGWHLPGRRLRWLTRSAAFEPMEYSKIGLEHFTPDYTDYFHELSEPVRDQLLSTQGRLYKAVSDETLAEIRAELDRRAYRGPASTGVTLLPGVEAIGGRVVDAPGAPGGEELDLDFVHFRTNTACGIRTQRLVLATGYAQRQPRLLGPIDALVRRDSRGRPLIRRDHRVVLEGTDAGLYVQNAELHTHGVGTPDLGLGAYRAASILNAVTGRELYRLPARTAHTSFSPAAAAAADEAIIRVTALPAQVTRARHAVAPRQNPSQPEDRRDRRPSTAPSRAGSVVAAGGDPDSSAGPAAAGSVVTGGDPDRSSGPAAALAAGDPEHHPSPGIDDPAAAPEGLD